MFTDKLNLNHRTSRLPAPAITGSLLGLLYIILFPFAGAISLLILGGYAIKQRFSTARH